MLTMRALTIWQPWATMIALGWKPIENRGWLPSEKQLKVGERFAIHAAARAIDEDTWDAALLTAHYAGRPMWTPDGLSDVERRFLHRCNAVRGMVLCTVEYGGALDALVSPGTVLRDDYEVRGPRTSDRHLLPWWNRSAKGWILSNPEQVQPVAVRGKQGLWHLPEDVVLTPAKAAR